METEKIIAGILLVLIVIALPVLTKLGVNLSKHNNK